MNMRERLARALAKCRDYQDWDVVGDGIPAWKLFESDAAAVLDELMTPTEGMLKQSFAAMNDTPSREWERLKAAGLTKRQMFDAKMRPRYTAMIKAAKEGK